MCVATGSTEIPSLQPVFEHAINSASAELNQKVLCYDVMHHGTHTMLSKMLYSLDQSVQIQHLSESCVTQLHGYLCRLEKLIVYKWPLATLAENVAIGTEALEFLLKSDLLSWREKKARFGKSTLRDGYFKLLTD